MEEKLDKVINLLEKVVALLEGDEKQELVAPSHLWLTISEVAELGMSKRTVYQKMNKNEWLWRDTGKRGRNGKRVREIKFAYLPDDLKEKWYAKHKVFKPI